jgi:hypothetical protein
MKKIFVLLFGLVAASQAFAAGTITCANGTATAVALVANSFAVQAFTPKCSANVQAAYEQNSIAFVVAGTSTKGKNKFVGSTGGGGITGSACAASPCAASDATGSTAAALALAT